MSPDPWLAAFVQNFGGDCPSCKRPVSSTGLCAHCHTQAQLGTRITEAYLASWGITLAVAALMAGFSLLTTWLFLRERGPMAERFIFALDTTIGVVMLLAVIALLCFRHRFCRLPRLMQWLLAALTVFLGCAEVASFAQLFMSR